MFIKQSAVVKEQSGNLMKHCDDAYYFISASSGSQSATMPYAQPHNLVPTTLQLLVDHSTLVLKQQRKHLRYNCSLHHALLLLVYI